MIRSEQHQELGEEYFRKLQAEVAEAPDNALNDFLTAVKPDSMGFCGKEGVDNED